MAQLVNKMKLQSIIFYSIIIKSNQNPSTDIIKNENIKFLQSIANETNGNICEANDISDTFHMLSNGIGLSTRPQNKKIIFEISIDFRIPCIYYSKVMKVNLPSLKKMKNITSSSYTNITGQYVNSNNNNDDNGGGVGSVTIDRTYRDPLDPDGLLGINIYIYIIAYLIIHYC